MVTWKGLALELLMTQVFFLPKKFEDNEVALPNIPKGVAFEKTKSRQSGYMTFYHEVKF